MKEDIQKITRAMIFFSNGLKDSAASILLDVRNDTKSRHVRDLVYQTIQSLDLDAYIKQNIKERKEAAEYCAKNFASAE